ncbi:MAG: ATP-dependent helicase HrpB, partial [Gammaproteobacteria bacterium]|nr:ATP-dependent helicase HrpB [Gammaproteobacteria bacterium]
WLEDQSILILEPRRLAARLACARMAELLGEPVGKTVGYRVRFDARVSARTRIEVVTEGILTRRIQNDPSLKGVGMVVFDEYHERSLNADLGLALCLDVINGLREDLRLLVMSASLDTVAVSRLLGDAPVVTGEGRSFPVVIRYLEYSTTDGVVELMVRAIRSAYLEQSGDILAFLPGGREIRLTMERLSDFAGETGCILQPLYGDLSRQEQDRAIRPSGKGQRKVVLATTIAETSLTIEGITTVIDGGWTRVPRFDAVAGMTRLDTVRVSQSSAEQRAGRAGRLGPGVCYRLWTESVQKGLTAHGAPEILNVDLAPLVLELLSWGVLDPAELSWLNPPPRAAFSQARQLLAELGAVDNQGRITASGRELAALPLHPRLAHLVMEASRVGQGNAGCDLAALLAERNLIRRSGGSRSVDIEDHLKILYLWREGKTHELQGSGADVTACRHVDRAARQWRRLLAGRKPHRGARVSASTGALLSQAFPDRIAQRRPGSTGGYLLSGGRGVRVPPDDPVNLHEFLVAAHLDAGHAAGRIYLAATIDKEELRQWCHGHLVVREDISWDSRARAVRCRSEERLGALVLESKPLTEPEPEAVLRTMLEGIRQLGMETLAWSKRSRALQARVLSMGQWRPEEGWPDMSDETLGRTLDEWLGPYLAGFSRMEQLQSLDLAEILNGLLSWPDQRRLMEGAPTHLSVPSGSRLPLHYTPGEAPILAVRLQEMFGLAETPTVCWDQVPVILHLLSPAGRPIQVTRDLHGFWERTYLEVKKELKGRYPKHHWPEDPWQARPTARAKKNRGSK